MAVTVAKACGVQQVISFRGAITFFPPNNQNHSLKSAFSGHLRLPASAVIVLQAKREYIYWGQKLHCMMMM